MEKAQPHSASPLIRSTTSTRRRDGPVSRSTGSTTTGVTRRDNRNVPMNPMRRCTPRRPVSKQNAM